MTNYETKDSGKREVYRSGMVRDIQEGKPRYDLIPRHPLRRLAELLDRGASKYGESNWALASSKEELLRFRASAVRHMFQWMDGDRSEDHGIAVCWNIFAYEEILSRIAGSVNLIYDFNDPRLPERFWSKVTIDPESGCWVWTAGKYATGYGAFNLDGVNRTAHSVAWEAYNGSMDEGLELDHLCRNRSCCSPYHLEPVTHQENVRRGKASGKGYCRAGHPKEVGTRCLTCSRISSGWKGNVVSGDRTTCPEGHPYDSENTWVEPSTGRRRCKLCKRETQRRYRRNRKWKLENDEDLTAS